MTCFLRVKEVLSDILSRQSDHENAMHNTVNQYSLFQLCEQCFSSPDLESVVAAITGVIDLDQDSDSGQTKGCQMVAPGILPDLDELKAFNASLPSLLDQSMNDFLKRIPRSLVSRGDSQSSSGWRILYIPQIGYLLRTTPNSLSEGIIDAMDDVQFQFVDDDAFYYTTLETMVLSRNFGDIYARILDAESSILLQLKKKCIQASSAIEAAARATATLDCLLSFAKIARMNDYCRPSFCDNDNDNDNNNNHEDDFIFIEEGRHAIQEQRLRLNATHIQENAFIPNNTALGCNGRGRINIITGPNNSGKTIYTRQIAIIVFLSQIGSFVPAKRATLSLVDNIIVTRCSAQSDTIIDGASSFMQELLTISYAIQHHSRRSLIIFDELGKGTTSSDGAALLYSTMKFLNNSQKGVPKVFVVTHFTELFRAPNLTLSGTVQYSYMKAYLRDKTADRMISTGPSTNSLTSLSPERHEIIFLYKLANLDMQSRSNLSSGSYAFFAALQAGCPQQMIERALHIMNVILSASNRREFLSLERSDERIDAKQQWARTVCELLLTICDKIVSENADPHALMSRHETKFRLRQSCDE